ncbi:Uncharacterised protein [Flavonifractor plautii]|uniref:Uncharacterized protein n=1 Tax=Flavonifractor plautii TaxID=292800 RepID=A0A174UT21_FLAPL|nr:Uncharacterised protein [Flavonifractor plautii]
MRIIPSENDRFVLVTLDFASLNQLFFLSTNAFQKDGSRFVRGVLRNKFSLNGFLQDRLFKQFWKAFV